MHVTVSFKVYDPMLNAQDCMIWLPLLVPICCTRYRSMAQNKEIYNNANLLLSIFLPVTVAVILISRTNLSRETLLRLYIISLGKGPRASSAMHTLFFPVEG